MADTTAVPPPMVRMLKAPVITQVVWRLMMNPVLLGCGIGVAGRPLREIYSPSSCGLPLTPSVWTV